MGRKVIKQGNGTLTITLPRKWTTKYHIQGGDELAVEQKGKSLLVTTANNIFSTNATQLFIPAPDLFLRRFFSILYRQTVDEIKVKFEDPAVLPLVEKEIDELFGFELVEQGRDYCILKNVAVARDSEFDTLMRRIFFMLKSSFQEILLALESGDYTQLGSVKRAEKTNNKLVNFCQRTVNKQGHLDAHRLTSTFYVASLLEQIADGLRDLSSALMDCTKPVSEETKHLFKETRSLFESLYKLYYKFDRDNLVAMTKKEKTAQKNALELMQVCDPKETLVLHYLLDIIKDMHHTTEMI